MSVKDTIRTAILHFTWHLKLAIVEDCSKHLVKTGLSERYLSERLCYAPRFLVAIERSSSTTYISLPASHDPVWLHIAISILTCLLHCSPDRPPSSQYLETLNILIQP